RSSPASTAAASVAPKPAATTSTASLRTDMHSPRGDAHLRSRPFTPRGGVATLVRDSTWFGTETAQDFVLAGARGRSRVSRNPRRSRRAQGRAADAGRSDKVRGMLVAIAVAAIAAIAPAAASASQLIDRDAKTATLQVNSKGEAMVSFSAAGKAKHVLAWGAVNALPPKKGGKQVSFSLDYSGGYKKYKKVNYWNAFGGSCGAYDGPALAWKVSACKASDGSYWALQSWQ